MFDRFASCAKSTVSLQEQSCEKTTCVELKKRWQQLFSGSSNEYQQFPNSKQELVSQLNRVKRRLIIIQKSKNLLSDELSLAKEELQVKNQKLKKLKHIKQIKTTDSSSKIQSLQYSMQLSQHIIIREKEQQLEILSKSLKQKDRVIKQLATKNQSLKDELIEKSKLLQNIQVSTRTQIEYYRSQIHELQSIIDHQHEKVSESYQTAQNVFQKQKQNWNSIKDILQNKIFNLNTEIKLANQKLAKCEKNLRDSKEKHKQMKTQLDSERQRYKWLFGLIQQAKIEFMHSQLVKQEQKDKHKKQELSKRRLQQILSNNNQNKSLKSEEQASTALPSSKTQRNQTPISAIAPFRLTPYHNQNNDSDFCQFIDISEI